MSFCRLVQAAKDKVLNALVAYRLFGHTVMGVYIEVIEDVMLTLNLDHTILVDGSGVGEQLSEVKQEGAAHEIHEPHLGAGVDNEVGTQGHAIDDCCVFSTRSTNPASFVVSAASQLSGMLLANTELEKRTRLGNAVPASDMFNAISWSPKERRATHRWFEGQLAGRQSWYPTGRGRLVPCPGD